jgi:hypothetical protein
MVRIFQEVLNRIGKLVKLNTRYFFLYLSLIHFALYNNIKQTVAEEENNDIEAFLTKKIFNKYEMNENSSGDEVSILAQNSSVTEWSLCTGSLSRCIFLATFLSLIIICTIIGNAFVIAAIYLEKNLHNVANYLIVSLAVADLMVAIMVKKLINKNRKKKENFRMF